VLVLVALAAFSLAAPGCTSLEEVAANRLAAAGLRDEVHQATQAWQDRLAQMTQDDPRRASAQAELTASAAKESALDAAIARIDALLAEAKNPSDPLTQAAGGLSPLIPEPFRSPLLLGAALTASLVRGQRLKTGLVSVAKGIDKAMRDDPEFAKKFRDHAPLFRSVQTPTAKRLIDRATRPTPIITLKAA
jgi:hypothetical protein